MGVSELLEREAVAVRGAATKRQALAAVAELAARRFGMDANVVLEGLLERERSGSTGMGAGVAIPHARLAGLQRMRAVFVKLENPVPFDALDDQPVDLIFALFAPEFAEGEHLRALARAARLLRGSELRQQLRQTRLPDAMHALLAQEAQPSAA